MGHQYNAAGGSGGGDALTFDPMDDGVSAYRVWSGITRDEAGWEAIIVALDGSPFRVNLAGNFGSVTFSETMDQQSEIALSGTDCDTLSDANNTLIHCTALVLNLPSLGSGYLDLIAALYADAVTNSVWTTGLTAYWSFKDRPMLPSFQMGVTVGENSEVFTFSGVWPDAPGSTQPKPIFSRDPLYDRHIWWADTALVMTDDQPSVLGGVPPTDHWLYDPNTSTFVGQGGYAGTDYPATGNATGDGEPYYQLSMLTALGLTYSDIY